MKFAPSLAEWPADGAPSAVTIGVFDGVHRGHQALLRLLLDRARSMGLRSVALTFDRHPRPADAVGVLEEQITSLQEKRELLEEAGIDGCAVIPVDEGLLDLEADEFVKRFLVQRLNTRLVVVGYDFRFGRGRRGDFQLLRSLGSEYGYTVLQAPAVLIDGAPVKSTRIRDCLRQGDLPGAAAMLGRLYRVVGEVSQGDRQGSKLGFPTINLRYPPEKLLPTPGVYAGLCRVGAQNWPAAINLGVRPTMRSPSPDSLSGSDQRPVLEAHLIGFEGNLYGQIVRLEFAERLREEKRFESLEALKEQIRRDVDETARRYSHHGGWMVWPDDPPHVAPAIAG
ncbi:MAG TPA: riboflavin biosynthesis protein RibF [Armatimonadota bacterium]|nr:riboflavin biosynthesis protein RibF [Armatimonadota bacterium]